MCSWSHGFDQPGHSIEVGGIHERRLSGLGVDQFAGVDGDGHEEPRQKLHERRLRVGGRLVDGLGVHRLVVSGDQSGDATDGGDEIRGRLHERRHRGHERRRIAREEPVDGRRVSSASKPQLGHLPHDHARGLELSHR